MIDGLDSWFCMCINFVATPGKRCWPAIFIIRVQNCCSFTVMVRSCRVGDLGFGGQFFFFSQDSFITYAEK